MNRGRWLIAAAAVSTIGWGTILPYQYAYAAQSRGWGAFVAAAAASLFSVGALIAAPLAGRLADRFSPVRIAIVARLGAALAAIALIGANRPSTFLLAMAALGFGVAAANPSQSILVLHWVDGTSRRTVFAWLFSAQALGMGIGAFLAGFLVDLSRRDGLMPGFALAAIGFVASAVLITVAGRGASPITAAGADGADPDANHGALAGLATLASSPALRWAAVVTITLALAFYAQFESGLPAYALTVLEGSELTVGLAAAVNCMAILALQWVMARVTARANPATLLMAVAGLWALTWVVLGLAGRVDPSLAGAIFVSSFALFALGETMYAPVLNPMIAELAPAGMVGTTLGVFAAIQTGFSAIGPMLAGLLLAGGSGTAFIVVHLGFSLVAVLAAIRLRRWLPHPRGVPSVTADPLDGEAALR